VKPILSTRKSNNKLHFSQVAKLSDKLEPPHWDASAFIAVDESEVRGVKDGVIVERFRAVSQRGDVATPWKLEIGDYFGFLGPPSTSISEGNFAPGLQAALRDGRFRRIFEWPTNGGVLRLGIPLRLDGAIRFDAIIARRQPSPGQLIWGLQQVRQSIVRPIGRRPLLKHFDCAPSYRANPNRIDPKVLKRMLRSNLQSEQPGRGAPVNFPSASSWP